MIWVTFVYYCIKPQRGDRCKGHVSVGYDEMCICTVIPVNVHWGVGGWGGGAFTNMDLLQTQPGGLSDTEVNYIHSTVRDEKLNR